MASLVKFLSNGVFSVANRTLIPSASKNFVSCYSTVSKFNRIVQKLGIPEPPKKPVTGFIRFQKENLASIQKNAKSQSELFAAAGEQWRQLSEDQKEKYNQVYKKEFAEYRKLYTEYINQLTPEQKKAIKTERKELKESREQAAEKKILKDEKTLLGKPKAPTSAFLLFAIAKNSSLKASALKDEWNALSEDQKKIYKQQSQTIRDAYEKELKAWEDKMMVEGKGHLVRKSRFLTKKDSDAKRSRKPKTE